MRRILSAFVTLIILTGPATAASETLTVKPSPHNVATTVAMLTAAIEGAGATVFATIDHTEGAMGVGLDLRPTTVVIFGNPRLGTRLMQASQSFGLDLPLKVLVWEDDGGTTQVGYVPMATLAARHGVAADHPAVQRATGALINLTDAAVAK